MEWNGVAHWNNRAKAKQGSSSKSTRSGTPIAEPIPDLGAGTELLLLLLLPLTPLPPCAATVDGAELSVTVTRLTGVEGEGKDDGKGEVPPPPPAAAAAAVLVVGVADACSVTVEATGLELFSAVDWG